MKVQSGFSVCTRIRTFWFRFILRIASDKKQLGNLILHKMIPSMFPDTILVPENHFAPIIFAMIMGQILDFAPLKSATFTGIKM